MLALATTRQGDVPLYLQALDGNASDKVSLVAAVEALAEQLRAEEDGRRKAPIFVADSGLYSAENVARPERRGGALDQPGARHLRGGAQQARGRPPRRARRLAAGGRPRPGRRSPRRPAGERWVVVRTTPGRGAGAGDAGAPGGADACGVGEGAVASEQPALRLCARRADRPRAAAQAASRRGCRSRRSCSPIRTHDRPGRPRTDAAPDGQVWQVETTVTLDAAALERAARRQACFLVATNVLDPAQLSDQELIQTYKEQHSVERGFAFLKDPLFLASSVFVKKPERIVALRLVMVLCLLVYRLAEHRLREQLAATGQTVPNQVSKPTDAADACAGSSSASRASTCSTSAMDLTPPQALVLRLQPLHQQVLALLGPVLRRILQIDQLTVRKVGVSSAPVRLAFVRLARLRSAFSRCAPSRTVSLRSTPCRSAPLRSAPLTLDAPNKTCVRSIPLKLARSISASDKSQPCRSAPLRSSRSNLEPFRFALLSLVDSRVAPVRSTNSSCAPANDVLIRSTPCKLNPFRSAPLKFAYDISTPSKLIGRRTFGFSAPDRRAMKSSSPIVLILNLGVGGLPLSLNSFNIC